MKSLSITALFVAISLLFNYLRARKSQAPREFKTIDDLIQWLASGAVKEAAIRDGVKLDYSPESIKSVDQILGKLHDQYVANPSFISVRGLSAAYGAYIGEVIRKSEPNVHWERDDALGEKIYPLIWNGGHHSYPMGWCQKRIENGDEDNVWVKYTILKDPKNLQRVKGRMGR